MDDTLYETEETGKSNKRVSVFRGWAVGGRFLNPFVSLSQLREVPPVYVSRTQPGMCVC